MQERIFQDLDTLSRIRALEDNALDIAEDYSYHRPLSDEEVADLRNEFAEKHMEIENLGKKKAVLMAEINTELKAKKSTAAAALAMIRTGNDPDRQRGSERDRVFYTGFRSRKNQSVRRRGHSHQRAPNEAG